MKQLLTPIEELAKKYQIETQATLMLNAMLEVLESVGSGNTPDRSDCGLCRNVENAVYDAGAKVAGGLGDYDLTHTLICTARDGMVAAGLWIQERATHWKSPNYSGYPKFPIRCPESMRPEEDPFICCDEDKYEGELAAALAKVAYYKVGVIGAMYDQTTEYGRARAEFARFLAEELRTVLGVPAPREVTDGDTE